MPLLTEKELKAALTGLPGWSARGKELEKEFSFPAYGTGVLFTIRISQLAEEQNHHPDLTLSWGKVRVAMTTHDEGGLSERDVRLARSIEKLSTGNTPEGPAPFVTRISSLVGMTVDEKAMAGLKWKAAGTGLSMATVAKRGQTRLVIYRLAADAPKDVFRRHRHTGGEVYIVLEGRLTDAFGSYGPGDLVSMLPGSIHTPVPEGKGLLLVLWPWGVEVLEKDR